MKIGLDSVETIIRREPGEKMRIQREFDENPGKLILQELFPGHYLLKDHRTRVIQECIY